MIRSVVLLCLLLMALALAGCGGQSGGSSAGPAGSNVTAKLSVAWDNTTKALEGPTSAQSAVIRILHSGANDVVQTLERPSGGGTQAVTVPNVPVGTDSMILNFYNEPSGNGAITRHVEGSLLVYGDGVTGVTVSGKPVDTITAVQVSLFPNSNTLVLNSTVNLVLTAKAADWSLVGGTDSRSWTVVSDHPEFVKVTPPPDGASSWTVTGVAQGTAIVTASLDGQTAKLTLNVIVPVFVHIANMSRQTLGDVDLGTFTGAATNLSAFTETVQLITSAGVVAVSESPQGGNPITLGSFTFAPGQSYTVVVYDGTPNPSCITLQDAFTANTTFESRCVNLIAAGTQIDLYLTAAGATTFGPSNLVATAVHSGVASNNFTAAPDDYTLWVVQAGTMTLITSAPFTATAGAKKTVYVVNNGQDPVHVVSLDR